MLLQLCYLVRVDDTAVAGERHEIEGLRIWHQAKCSAWLR